MIGHFVSKTRTRGFVFVFVAAITLSATLASHAQTDDATRRTQQSSGALVRQEAGSKAIFAATSTVRASFLPPEVSGLGCLPFSIAVGDVNGDGKPDLVVADWYQSCDGVWGLGEVDVLLGNGDGTFQAPVSYNSGGFQALGVAVGDLNGDGKLDIVVANSCANGDNTCPGQVAVLLGNGDGTFQPAVGYFSGGDQPYAVTVVDVNGDGHPDVIAANSCTANPGGGCTTPGSAGILLGNGDGTLQPGVSYPSDANTSVVALAVGDLNGDGYLDVVMVGGQDVGVISVLLGNGNGTFQPEVSYDSGGYQPNSVAIADVNGDGHPDVIVASYCQSLNQNCNVGNLAVSLGTGDGTLRAPVNYRAGGYDARSVAIADVNGDGHPDLIAATSYLNGLGTGPGAVGVLLGNGDGTFQVSEAFPSGGSSPISLAVADLNGDGKPDLLLANFCNLICNGAAHGTVGVLLNNSGVPQATTTAALVCSPASSSGYGQTVTCTATVRPASGSPNGTVILYDGLTPAGNTQLVNRKAIIPVSSLAVGSHLLMAVYQGSSAFAPSKSTSLSHSVVAASTTVSMASSANPAPIGQLVTITATVVGQYGGGTATGTVTFKTGGNIVATVPVKSNQATYSHAYPTRAVRSITAIYSGDSNNGGSTSPAFEEAIGSIPYPTHTAVTTSGSPSLLGQPVTFTAIVSFAIGNAVPNGELVHFYDGPTEIGSGVTLNGVATLTTSSLKAGTHTIKAAYGGDASLEASRSSVIQVVEP